MDRAFPSWASASPLRTGDSRSGHRPVQAWSRAETTGVCSPLFGEGSKPGEEVLAHLQLQQWDPGP